MRFSHFFIFLAAISFLLFLISFNKFFEPLTISETDALNDIIFKESTDDESVVIKQIQELAIKDDNVEIILKSEIPDKQKLIQLKTYICELVTNRNETDEFSETPPEDKLSCKDFIKIMKVIGSTDSEYNINYTNKVNEFKSLLIDDTAYNSVLDSSDTDEIKFMGPSIPNLTSLTNDILFGSNSIPTPKPIPDEGTSTDTPTDEGTSTDEPTPIEE